MKMNKSKVIEYDFLFKFCRERDQNKHCKHHLYQVSISKLLCFCVSLFIYKLIYISIVLNYLLKVQGQSVRGVQEICP